MANTQQIQPKLLTKLSSGNDSKAPAIALAKPNANQVPLYSLYAVPGSAGEQPIHFVMMKDGTVVPIPENQLVQGSGYVKLA